MVLPLDNPEYREKQQAEQGYANQQRLRCGSDFFTDQVQRRDKSQLQKTESEIRKPVEKGFIEGKSRSNKHAGREKKDQAQS